MGKKNPKVDAYIAAQADFAKPILRHLRALVHKHCPDCVEEIKWSSPHFAYKGMFCGMSAFKQHAAFGFWHPLLREGDNSLEGRGSYGKLATLKDLPSDVYLAGKIREAMRLNDEGIKAPKGWKTKKPPVVTPPDLESALRRNKLAAKTYAAFPESCKREYADWIAEAKRDETRAKRLVQTIEWLAEGKRRNWKYENC